jgi:hypothetical protein
MAQPSRRTTSFPAARAIDPTRSFVQGASPSRVWSRTDTGWSSREWEPKERESYITNVLNRQPHSGEL